MNHFFEKNKTVLSVDYSFNEHKKGELLIIKCSKKHNYHNHDLLSALINYWEEEIGLYNAVFLLSTNTIHSRKKQTLFTTVTWTRTNIVNMIYPFTMMAHTN